MPKQIQSTHYVAPRNGGKEAVHRRETVVVEKASAGANHPRQRFADVKPPEEEEVDGLRCAKLRLGALFGDEKEPKSQFFFLWLARERNYLPVRAEHVELAWSDRIPTNVAHVDDLREAAPGLWFPYLCR